MANQVPYGFYNLTDHYGTLVTTVGVQTVFDALEATIAEHNRVMDTFFNLFVRRTTDFQMNFRTPATARLQSVDADGRALPVKGGAQYTMAWPIGRGAHAWGSTYEAGVRMTVREAADLTEQALTADRNWIRDKILGALFTNVQYTFTDELRGPLLINPLANGDAQLYQTTGGAAGPAAAQHYLAQAAPIADATNPYPFIEDLLTSYPGQGGDVLAFIPTGLVATTRALATFLPEQDPNIQTGANASVLVGTPSAATPGRLIGYADGVFIYEWKQLPAGYIVATVTNGERPIAMREDAIDALRGFNRVAERVDFPYQEVQYRRMAGFGGWNRTGAVVYRVGNGSYAIPTNYSAATMD